MTSAQSLALLIEQYPDAPEVVFGVRAAPLSSVEINSNLAEMFHADREGVLRLAEIEGSRHDREHRAR